MLLESSQNCIEAAADAIQGGLEADPKKQDLLDMKDEILKLSKLSMCDSLLQQAKDLMTKVSSFSMISRVLLMHSLLY